MNDSRQTTTYMLYQKDEAGTISKVCGPVFKNDIQKVRETLFTNLPGETCVIEESLFAQRHGDLYMQHLYFYWMDKVSVYLHCNSDWMGKFYLSKNPMGFAGSWFHIFETTETREDGTENIRIKINTAVDVDPFHRSRLLHEIVRILPHQMILGKTYFTGSDKRLHLGDSAGPGKKSGAYQRFLAESLLNSCCLQ